MIAVTARVHRLTVATRYVRDFHKFEAEWWSGVIRSRASDWDRTGEIRPTATPISLRVSLKRTTLCEDIACRSLVRAAVNTILCRSRGLFRWRNRDNSPGRRDYDQPAFRTSNVKIGPNLIAIVIEGCR